MAAAARVIERQAVEARPHRGDWTVRLDNGEAIEAIGLVLAIGNQPPEPLPFGAGSSRVINNRGAVIVPGPWVR
jgi:hypothetical protein